MVGTTSKFPENLMPLNLACFYRSLVFQLCLSYYMQETRPPKNSPIWSIGWVSWQLSPSKRNLNSLGVKLWQPSSVRTTWVTVPSEALFASKSS